jgi:hypothetical protein
MTAVRTLIRYQSGFTGYWSDSHHVADQPLQLSYPPLELPDSARADYILVCLHCLQPAFAHALIKICDDAIRR